MSDSPVSRPKRNSSFASFYIDEDDFEDAPSTASSSKKLAKEDVFVISEKLERASSDKDDSDDTEVESFESKVGAKVSTKPVKKQVAKIKKTNSSKGKAKSNSAKSIVKDSSKLKESEDDEDFEVVVDDEDSESNYAHKLKNGKMVEDENFDENNGAAAVKSRKATANKTRNSLQSKSVTSVPSRPSIVSSRPKLQLPSSIEKVRIPGQQNGPRRVGLSRSAPTRPLSPVKLKKID